MKTLSFFKGLSWLILLNLLIKPVWIFFIDRQVQNIAGNEAYGQYFAVTGLSYVLYFLADAGLSNMLNQRIANGQPVNVSKLLQIKFSLVGAYLLLSLLTGWLTQVQHWQLLLYVAGIQALTSLFVFLRSLITANQFFTVDAWFSVVDKLLMTLICGSVIYSSFFGKMTLPLFLQIQLLCTSIAVVLAAFFVGRKGLIRSAVQNDPLPVIRYVLPFAAIILLMSVHNRLDGFLLERIHSDGSLEAGIYASAYRLLDASNMAGYLAASFLVPFIARHQLDKKVVQRVILNTRHGLMLLAVGLLSFSFAFASWIQQLLYHSSDRYHAQVTALCIAALPGYYLTHVYGSLLTATARFRSFIAILSVSVLLNVLLNGFLIPGYGALGCCIAALVSEWIGGMLLWWTASRQLSLNHGTNSMLVYLLAGVAMTAWFFLIKMAVNNVWIILAITAGLTIVLLMAKISHFKKYFIAFR